MSPSLRSLLRRVVSHVYVMDLGPGPVAVTEPKRPVEIERIGRAGVVRLVESTRAYLPAHAIAYLVERVLRGRAEVFVARVDGRVVHHTTMQFGPGEVSGLPVAPGDVFFGPSFTVADARGLRVFPHVAGVAFEHYRRQGARRVVCFVNPDNDKSIHGLVRIGLRPDGEMSYLRALGVLRLAVTVTGACATRAGTPGR
ncbi:MAG: hypothetical protein FJ087_20950 [Deltaproteobacteria bacterium]|nr:hypothetical protein [Deltaproteobacteria bacterium]